MNWRLLFRRYLTPDDGVTAIALPQETGHRIRNRIQRINPPAAPELYLRLRWIWSTMRVNHNEDHAEAIEWDAVLDDLQRAPTVASFCDEGGDGMLLLHFICALRPPPDVVRAVLAAYPDGVTKESSPWGITPLMLACGRNASPEVISLLLEGKGRGMIRVKSGGGNPWGFNAAIHDACRDEAVSAAVVRQLLIVDPTVANMPVDYRRGISPGETPTEILIRRASSFGPDAWTSAAGEKLRYVMCARHYGTIVSRVSHQSTLHAALAIPGVPKYVVWLSLRHEGGSAAGVRDVMGNLPLHYAIKRRDLELPPVLCELLKIFPDGASCKDSSGRYPLHVALESGRTWSTGIAVLYHSHSPAIKFKDHATGMYPFALAAAYSDIETVFCLLRANPDFISTADTVRQPLRVWQL